MTTANAEMTTRAWEQWKRRRRSVREEDLTHLLDKRDAINKKFAPDGPLARFTWDVTMLFSLVRDYAAGTYFDVPWVTVAGAVSALECVLAPACSVGERSGPDAPDEATLVALYLMAMGWELSEYKRWLVRASSMRLSGT
jgi:hypothetical protein